MTEPIRVSWSQIRAHEECRQKSALIRQGKRGPAANLRGYYHGMVVDSAMREYLADPDRRIGQMAARIDALIDEGIEAARISGDGIVRWKSANDRDDLYQFCLELVTRLEPILDSYVLPYPFRHGYRFKAPMDAAGTPLLLVGEMDLLVQDGGPIVWDLKGTRDDQYYRKVLGQLVFYDIANWCMTGEKTRHTGLIQPMCKEQVLKYVVTDDERRTMLARILRYASDVKFERQACKPGTAGCGWCEVNHACPRFAPDTTATGTHTLSLGAGLRAAAKDPT